MIGLPLAIDAAWTYSLRGLYVPMLPFVDPPAQLHWILDHPWSYAAVVGKAICRLDNYSFMIGVFGWLGPHLAALDSRDLLGRFGPHGRAGRRQAAAAEPSCQGGGVWALTYSRPR